MSAAPPLPPGGPIEASPADAARLGSAVGLTLAALGIACGDIGTSPLYVMKTVFDKATKVQI